MKLPRLTPPLRAAMIRIGMKMSCIARAGRTDPRSLPQMISQLVRRESSKAFHVCFSRSSVITPLVTVGASSTSWNLDADKLWWWNTPVTPLTLLGLAFVVQTIFFGSAYKILTRIEETNVSLPLSSRSR